MLSTNFSTFLYSAGKRILTSGWYKTPWRYVNFASNPELGDLIAGTGEFRKLRWTDPRRGKGWRGSLTAIVSSNTLPHLHKAACAADASRAVHCGQRELRISEAQNQALAGHVEVGFLGEL